ncbi:hypothetical protein PVAND_006186 [Polypedilum vanderplanki]|uniref:PXA domain-containing protein n=1 Tax=Polypedilum vanderplanki TaxID=319348 RepID=A0A9J6C394_POLVA|nr:hypothetical protein PVAND_006186 [Polypedilum vanderplanki]
MTILQLSLIFKDSIALKTFILAVILITLSCIYSLSLGIYFGLFFIISLTFVVFFNQSSTTRNHLQEIVESFLKSDNETKSSSNDDKIFLAKGLDETLERFFTRLLDNVFKSWWSNVSSDETFLYTLKLELTRALRKLALRYKNVDYPVLISTKLLPIVYSHFSQIEHLMKTKETREQQIKSFLEIQSPHPATLNRKAELQYLRSLSENLMPYLFSKNNYKCRAAYNIVRELLTNWVFLQITDLIAEPDIINMLVILATNKSTTAIKELNDKTQVELLANFIKINENKAIGSDQRVDNNFFKDQEKLYNFMQYLKSQNCNDVEILKFVLDVEHLNAELEKSSVILDPVKLSSLQQTSEKLLTLYRDNLFKGEENEKPSDLIKCYDHAKKHLEYKWKFDFYKSGDYYKYIYGDREIYNTSKEEKEEQITETISTQKLSAKIKNAMTMKIAVDGIEDDIQVYDAIDAGSISPFHYYNSMAVKLRKERGQDLDNFMVTFFNSIEQEGDIGEDIASKTHSKSEKEKQHDKIKLGNIELYKNLFNTTGQSNAQLMTISYVKNPTQSLIYFLAKIVKFHETFLRLIVGILNFFPHSDKLVLMSIRKICEKLVNQAILSHLICELEEKLFDSKPTHRSTQEEQNARRHLAIERLDKLKNGLSSNLLLLQNPIINKHLIYSLIDVLIIEGFNELNPNLMPK